jgi:hypothetical protein
MAYSATGRTAGEEISSTYEGRHVTFLESELTHPTHGDGFVDKGDPVICGTMVGVALLSAAAATDYISVDTEGIWALNVVASDVAGTSAVAVGDELFISSSGVISKISTGLPFGKALSTLSGSATAAVGIVKVHAPVPAKGQFAASYTQFAAADVAKGFFVCPAACKVVDAEISYATPAGQAGTLQIEKCGAGVAAGAGTVMLASAFDLYSTANTGQRIVSVGAAATMAAGDLIRLRLASGAATSLAGAVLTVRMEWV